MSTEDWCDAVIGDLLTRCDYGVSVALSVQPVGVPVLRMGNISDHRLDLSDLKYADLSSMPADKVLVRRGDVLLNRTNSYDKVGKVALVDTDAPLAFASYLVRLRTNERAVPEWLHFSLSSPAFQARIRSLATKGVSQVNLNPSKLRGESIRVPPLPEQRKIAAILSSVDEAIEKTQAVIDQVQVVKKGLMQELLTKGMPGRHKTFKQTEIGEVPSGWEIKRLEEVAVVSSGGTPSRTEPAYWGGDIPWVKTGEVNYRAIRETEEYLTSRGVEESAAKLLPPGTVLMAMYGQGRTRGRVAWLEVSATANQACAAIESDDAMSVRFVYHVLSSMYESIRSIGNEGSQKNLNLGLIKQVRIPVPSTEEQREIGAIMDAIDNRGESESRLLKACQQLKSALATLLLTGTLRVPLPSEPA